MFVDFVVVFVFVDIVDVLLMFVDVLDSCGFCYFVFLLVFLCLRPHPHPRQCPQICK